jgi:hypothetical protein
MRARNKKGAVSCYFISLSTEIGPQKMFKNILLKEFSEKSNSTQENGQVITAFLLPW